MTRLITNSQDQDMHDADLYYSRGNMDIVYKIILKHKLIRKIGEILIKA